MLSLTISETTQCFLCQQISDKYHPKSNQVRPRTPQFVTLNRPTTPDVPRLVARAEA
ncbi:hypothetical protein Mapa_001452 [Marchantia paleacea]|nr:hypothetical protein Mapa_001452 [Marchantia paleacea]